MARMRTLKQAIAYIQAEDPQTNLTLYALRRLIKSGEFKNAIYTGKKIIIDVDSLSAFLSNPQHYENDNSNKSIRRIRG